MTIFPPKKAEKLNFLIHIDVLMLCRKFESILINILNYVPLDNTSFSLDYPGILQQPSTNRIMITDYINNNNNDNNI